MLKELIRAFLLVFVAEMGDKTQIIAMTFATQYKVMEVLLGVTIGVLFNHGIAIVLGNFISKVVPINLIQIIAGLLFIIFGINALKIDGEENVENKKALNPVAAVSIAFFVGELGDKTQFTAMTLAAEANYPVFILMGTTLGMIATSGLGIFVGSRIGEKIPELLVKIVSSLVFVFFGTIKLFDSVPGNYLTLRNIVLMLSVLIIVETSLIFRLVRDGKLKSKASSLKYVAERLKRQTKELKKTLDSICLGESKCGTCSSSSCLIGYTKFILKEAYENGNYYKDLNVNIDKLLKKNYDKGKVRDALIMIISDFKKYGWDFNDDFVVMKIKNALEVYLFGKRVENVDNINDYIEEVKIYDKELETVLRKRFS